MAAANANDESRSAQSASAKAVLSDEEAAALLEKSSPDAVRTFDITACRISRTRLPNLEHIGKVFSIRASATLSQLVGREVRMAFEGLDHAKCADCLAALPNPACMAMVRLKPLPNLALLSMQPQILLALLDGFFGGSGRGSSDAAAASSSAAQRFLGVMMRNFAADFAASWAPIAPVEFELVKQEHDARFVTLGPAHDALIVARFVVQCGELEGTFEWLLPESVIAPVREALAADGGVPTPTTAKSWMPDLSAALQGAQIETRAVLSQVTLSLRELVRLSPGDIVPIEAPEHVTLLADGIPLFRGRFGISQGRNALKILDGVPHDHS